MRTRIKTVTNRYGEFVLLPFPWETFSFGYACGAPERVKMYRVDENTKGLVLFSEARNMKVAVRYCHGKAVD